MAASEPTRNWIKLVVLLAIFGPLIAWLSLRSIEEQKPMEQMDKEADAYFDSIDAMNSTL